MNPTRRTLIAAVPAAMVTRRLLLRPPRDSDLDTLVTLYADPAVTQVSFRLPLEADRFGSLALSALSDDVVAAMRHTTIKGRKAKVRRERF